MKDKVFKRKLSRARKTAKSWHDGVVYGGGLVMTDQVFGTAKKIEQFYDGPHKEEVLLAAYLYKAREKNRLNDATKKAMDNGTADNSNIKIAKAFSPIVARIVDELLSEPAEDKTQTKEQQWQEKTKWALDLSREAQAILLAEKLQNFEISRDKPNMKKPLQWHMEYYKTRMIMVDALQKACPALHNECVNVADEGVKSLQARQAALINQNAGNGMV